MRTARTLLAMMAAGALAACAPAMEPEATMGGAADEQAIRDTIARVETAWNNKDAEGLTALVTDDYNGINVEGMHIQGRTAYRANLVKEFAAERPEGFRLSILPGYIHWQGADAAAVGGTWRVDALPEGAPNTGSWLVVMERDGADWLMSNGLVATYVPMPTGGQ